MPENKVIKTGIFIYGGTATGTIQIVETSWRPGSGDHEDPEELREDQFGTFFQVSYSLYTDSIESRSGGGYHDSLQDAVKTVEKFCEQVEWVK